MHRVLSKQLVPSLLILLIWSGSGQAGFTAADAAGGASVGQPAGAGGVEAKKPEKEPKYKEGELLVKFRARATEPAKAKVHARHNSKLLNEFRALRIHHVKVKEGVPVEEAIKQYQADPDVEYAEPNFSYTVDATPNDPRFQELWGLRNTGQSGGTPNADIHATAAWETTTGSSSVVMAVIDTGTEYTHPDLAANIWNNPWEIPGDGIDNDGNGYIDDIHGIDAANSDADPMDDHGHGTHVAGTIGGVGANAEGVVGVNWNIKMMPCKYLNSAGKGFTNGAITCLQYIKGMKDRGVNIVATSNSWGGGPYSRALYDAINAMPDVLFIAAAGNDGQDNDRYDHYPADYDLPNIISVAATDNKDQLASFSNYGKRSVHVGAPGVSILSTVSTQNKWGLTGGYGVLSGTSMATPHVSGLAALLKAQDPGRDWKSIKNLILSSGEPVPALKDKTVTGNRISAAGGVACADRPVFAARQLPAGVTPGEPATVSVISINCASPAAPVRVTTSGGESLALADDGLGADQAAGDGLFTGTWMPTREGERLDISSPAGALAVTVPPLRIYQHQPEANTRAPYRQGWGAIGGLKPYRWSILSGALPPGLALEDAGGVITGTPTVTGSYPITVQVTDSIGGSSTANLSFKVADDFVLEQSAQPFDSGDWDMNYKITFDKGGNYYTAGSSLVAASGSLDAVLRKYDQGGALLWSRSYGATFDEYTADVQLDGDGNVYVAGRTRDQQHGKNDWFLVKYDAAGNQLWSTIYDSGGQDYMGGIASDAEGNIYASGATTFLYPDTMEFEDRLQTVKFDPAGNVVWERLSPHSGFFPDGHDFGSGVAVDSSGNVYAAGGTSSATAEPDPSNPGKYCRTANLVVVKYDPSGNELWANTSVKANYLECSSNIVMGNSGGIAIDTADNLYLTSSPSPIQGDACRIAKYSKNGELLWQSAYFSPAPYNYAKCNDIAVDGAGNSFVAVAKSRSLTDYYFSILKYDAAGALLWEKNLDAGHSTSSIPNGYAGAFGVALDPAEGLHATGHFYNGLDFDTLTVTLKDLAALLRLEEFLLPGGLKGNSYQGQLLAAGGVKPYAWALVPGGLPPGLALDSATGVISGTPLASGSFAFTAQVTDAKGATASAPATIVITSTELTVTGYGPAEGAAVAADTLVQATFSDPLDPATLTAASFTLSRGGLGKAIAAGGGCALAVMLDGTATSWGSGSCTVPAGTATLAGVAAGYLHTLAVRSDGTLVGWGDNRYGESAIPPGVTGVTAVAAGYNDSVALKSDGTVAAWGYNYYGQATVPPGLTDVAAIAAGYYHTLALKKDGTVVAWGINTHGEGSVPAGLGPVTAIGAGWGHNVVLKGDGTVAAWGSNGHGQTSVPAGLGDVVAVAAGGYHSVALKRDGTVVAWGDDSSGQSSIPAGLSGVRAIAAGTYHTVALKSDGTVIAWGNGFTPSATPADLTSSFNVSGTLSYHAPTRTAALTPSAPLQDAVTYYARVSGVASETGVPLASGVTWSFRISDPVFITTPTLPGISLGSTYSQTLTAAGGAPPYSWSIVSGVLPNGLACATSTGTISGTATAAGLYSFSAEVTDSHNSKSAKPFSIYVPVQGCLTLPVRLSGAMTGTYTSFAEAYARATDNDTIQLQNLELGGDVVLDRDITTLLEGGYQCGFTAGANSTTLLGKLRLMKGKAKLDKLRMR